MASRTDLGRDPGGFGKDSIYFSSRMVPGLWARFQHYRCILRRKRIGFIKKNIEIDKKFAELQIILVGSMKIFGTKIFGSENPKKFLDLS